MRVRIKTIYLPILIFSLLALGVFLGRFLNFPVDLPATAENNSRIKLNKLLDFINNDYVDNVNTDSIVNTTVDNILEKLDPHSVYISSADQALESQNMRGDFVGIGVNFYVINDTIAIVKPIENGPAEKAGLLAGDRILYANNFKLYGNKKSSDSLFSLLKGEENSEVDLTIFRKSSNKTLKYKIIRKTIAIKSVDVALLLKPKTGYIKINRFAETTYDEFKSSLTKLQKAGINELVVDLRDNSGGYLEIAEKIADEFLTDKQLIVFTKNKKGKITKKFATADGSFEKGKIAVLINEYSASASEILAGAIQDNDRGIIIGRRSFGKGLVQQEMDFEDGSAVRLTIARYYTPTGRSIQKPYTKGKVAYYKDFDKRFQNGELYKKDSIKINDTLKFKTPKGKIVYGGGGIVPDIFVPIEGNLGDENINRILDSGILEQFVFQELDNKRSEFKNIPFEKIVLKINENDTFFNDFKKFCQKNNLEINFDKTRSIVLHYVSAELAKQLYNQSKYYQIILKNDTMIKAVFTVL
jgi:carboxyl-terminal processing protease